MGAAHDAHRGNPAEPVGDGSAAEFLAAGRRGGRRVRSRLAFVPCPPSCDSARGVCAVVIVDMMAEDYILVKLIITIRIIIYIYYFHDKNDTHHYDYSNIYLLTYEP